MKITTEIITPEVAREMLKANVHNRDARPRHVLHLAGAMQRGEWAANGDAIKFSGEGVLLDGQHRLMAVIEAGVPITTIVVRGLASHTQITMDTHARRKLSDNLKLAGEIHCATLAGALSMLWRYETGDVRNGNSKPSHPQLLDLLDKNPELRECVKVGQRLGAQLHFSPSTLTVARLIFERIHSEDSSFFFDRLGDGAGLEEDDAIRRVREAIIQNAMSRAKFNKVYMFALLIKGWNAYREGRPVAALRWRLGGARPEDFPTPK